MKRANRLIEPIGAGVSLPEYIASRCRSVGFDCFRRLKMEVDLLVMLWVGASDGTSSSQMDATRWLEAAAQSSGKNR